jgi:hypothetical protein
MLFYVEISKYTEHSQKEEKNDTIYRKLDWFSICTKLDGEQFQFFRHIS